MRDNKRLFVFIVFIFICYMTSVAQEDAFLWKVYKTCRKDITINGISSEVLRREKSTFSLKDIIHWPKDSLSMIIIPTDTSRIGNKDYIKNARYPIYNNRAKANDMNGHNVLWWIKYNQTSGMSGSAIVFEEYVDYMIDDTIVIFPESFGIETNDEENFFLTFVKDGRIIDIQAYTDDENKSFYFTKQQLVDAGYDFIKELTLSYGYKNYSDILVKNFIIKTVE